MFIGKEIKVGDIKKNPPIMVSVFNYEAWEEAQMILSTVTAKELNENYPNDSYVGKSFELVQYKHENPEKKYNLVNLTEIGEPTREDFGLSPDGASVDMETGELLPESYDTSEIDPHDNEVVPEEIESVKDNSNKAVKQKGRVKV